jgi:hypothetical protein
LDSDRHRGGRYTWRLLTFVILALKLISSNGHLKTLIAFVILSKKNQTALGYITKSNIIMSIIISLYYRTVQRRPQNEPLVN